MTVLVYPDPAALAEMTGARLCLTLADAASRREAVHLAVAGGSVGTQILAPLASSPLSKHVDWAAVHVWWVDERFVPADDPERNDGALDELFGALPLPTENVHRMPTPQTAATVAEGAEMYARELAAHAPDGARLPVFDLVLLGMGPDGHVASLFPGHPGLEVDSDELGQVAFAVTDSPKPPAERISLSLAALKHSRQVWVAAWGDGKASAIADALAGVPVADIPAAGVAGAERTLWLTDLAGATRLPCPVK